jgi:hypothetical protein
MSAIAVSQVEEDIKQLSLRDQLWLMERLAQYIREKASDDQGEQIIQYDQKANGHQQELCGSGSDVAPSAQTLSPLDLIPIPWTDKTLLMGAMDRLMQKLDITGEPIGAQAARMLIQQEANLGPNELSQGIIDMREEKLRDRGLF